jgi:hypothetical protein
LRSRLDDGFITIVGSDVTAIVQQEGEEEVEALRGYSDCLEAGLGFLSHRFKQIRVDRVQRWGRIELRQWWSGEGRGGDGENKGNIISNCKRDPLHFGLPDPTDR